MRRAPHVSRLASSRALASGLSPRSVARRAPNRRRYADTMPRALEPPATSAPPVRGPRPLLKWAGGKRQLLPVFRAFYPERLSRYYEPFLGSGAVFFDLFAQGRLASKDVPLADSNPAPRPCYPP